MKKLIFLYSLVLWKCWGMIAVLFTSTSSICKHTQAVFRWSSTQHGQLQSSLINLNANKTKSDDGNWRRTRVHTRKLWLRVPKSNGASGRWKFKRPLGGIRPSRLLPLFPAVAKPRTKRFQRRYFWWRFCGLYSSSSAERWKQTSGCRTHFLYWFISKSSNGAGFVRETRLLPSILLQRAKNVEGFLHFLTHSTEQNNICLFNIFSLSALPTGQRLLGVSGWWGRSHRRPQWKTTAAKGSHTCLTCFCHEFQVHFLPHLQR